jgi:hypothetical protein
MSKVPYTNNTSRHMNVGGKLIAPGDTREVDQRDVPGFKQAAKPAPAERDQVRELLEKGVKAIVSELPNLTDAQLIALADGEKAGKDRKSLLEAIAAEQLGRAQHEETQILDLPKDQLLAAIKDPNKVTNEDLEQLFQAEEAGQNREEILEAIDEEEARRAT